MWFQYVIPAILHDSSLVRYGFLLIRYFLCTFDLQMYSFPSLFHFTLNNLPNIWFADYKFVIGIYELANVYITLFRRDTLHFVNIINPKGIDERHTSIIIYYNNGPKLKKWITWMSFFFINHIEVLLIRLELLKNESFWFKICISDGIYFIYLNNSCS